jgi:radical SAM protein with 4Fe4S-binding SPASM domain
MLELIPTLRQVNASVLVPAGVRLFLGNNVGYFNDFDNGPGQTVSVGAELRSAWTGCKAGQAVLGIEADGTLKGCPSLPTAAYSAGNLRRDNLENLLSGQGKVHEIARRDIDDLWGFCRSCEYAETCMGGCTWTAHALFGRSGNNPYCYHRAETMRAHGLQEMIVMSERAPGDPFDHGKFEIALVPVPVAPTAQPAASDMDARQYLRKFNQR